MWTGGQDGAAGGKETEVDLGPGQLSLNGHNPLRNLEKTIQIKPCFPGCWEGFFAREGGETMFYLVVVV